MFHTMFVARDAQHSTLAGGTQSVKAKLLTLNDVPLGLSWTFNGNHVEFKNSSMDLAVI